MRVRSSQCAKKAFPLSVEVHDEKGKRTTDSFFAKKKKLPCQLFYGGCSAKNDTFTIQANQRQLIVAILKQLTNHHLRQNNNVTVLL